MELPQDFINQVRQGRAVLFLGAGANIGALNSEEKEPPLGDDLRDLIAERFLSSNHALDSLSWVAELAASASNLFEVQDYIATQFNNLKPAAHHLMIPTFRWRGIATTNYDRLIETTYSSADKSIQKIVPFLSNKDRVDEKLRDSSSIALLKLHGCITRTHDEGLPLILTIEQFARYEKERTRLVQMLEEWGSENTIIFVGHKLHDPDLREMILKLSRNIDARPRYYLIRPNVSDVERDFWNEKKITVLNDTFEKVLKQLDTVIPSNFRILATKLDFSHPVQIRYKVNEKPSAALFDFLENDVEYVHDGIASSQGDASSFYSGISQGWHPILMNFDVRRNLTNKLIEDIILRLEEDRPSSVELYAVRAEAGAGKSVLLRRFAWEATIEASAICLYYKKPSVFGFESLRELCNATKERIFLFIDNAANNASFIRSLLIFAKTNKLPLTIITAERTNEWNIRCECLEEYLSNFYKLFYLNKSEIEDLVNKLSEHNALGPNLTGKSTEEQVKEFEDKAGRQLLVALHEATRGRSFEEILLDEYNNIVPPEAQKLYLTVCVLNRLQVPVRAGLISRVHEIPFTLFKDRFFKPLEHVVNVVKLPWGDNAYQARHSEIAQIIFENVLTDPIERFHEYIRVVSLLNPSYSVDYDSMRGMLSARAINDLFPSYEDAKAIYDTAEKVLDDKAFFYHQRANYERIRPDGNLSFAQSLLEKARLLRKNNAPILHTLAEVLRARAEAAEKQLERIRFRREARAVLSSISSTDRYAIVTGLRINLDELRDLFASDLSTDRDIDDAIRITERDIENARQRFPGDKFVLNVEFNFAKLIDDHDRSFEVLKRTRESNPRDPFIASRYATILKNKGDLEGALKCIHEALEGNRGDKQLNFQYAELLRQNEKVSSDDLIYYYRRAFTKWDSNYESQFWYARFAFETNDQERLKESKEVFSHLRDVPIEFANRVKIKDAIGGLKQPEKFSGTITRVESTHGFLSIDGTGQWLFYHETDVKPGTLDHLRSGERVIFSIGFSLRGPQAIGIELEGG